MGSSLILSIHQAWVATLGPNLGFLLETADATTNWDTVGRQREQVEVNDLYIFKLYYQTIR
jgi:hypothetical protein